MQLRGRSVPPGKNAKPQPSPSTRDDTATAITTTTATATATTTSTSTAITPITTGALPAVSPNKPPSTLLSQAEALARMTFELNLRVVCQHADRLERDLAALVAKTERDEAFRLENQTRLTQMMVQIRAVQDNMASLGGGQDDVRGGLERLERETTQFVGGFRDELADLRGGLADVLGQLDQCATVDDVRDEMHASSLMDPEMRKRDQARILALQREFRPRVEQAISSTRRWNRDHKTTHHPDARFVANYLKKQAQRDPHMAVLLQRALQRRVRLRTSCLPGRTWSQPQSLDELCQRAQWQDVIDMVQDVLVTNEQRTMRLLRRASGQ